MGAMRSEGAWIILISVVLAAGQARAELPLFPLDLAQPLVSPQTSPSMLDHDGEPLALGAPRFSLVVGGAYLPLAYTEEHLTPLRVEHSVAAVIGAAVGFGAADLGVAFPIHLALLGQREGLAWSASAPGDLVVVPRVTPIPPGRSAIGLVLSAPISFPTGDSATYAGASGFTAEPRLLFSAHPGRFGVAVRPGMRLQGGTRLSQPHLSDGFTLRVATGIALGRKRNIRPEVGLDGTLPLSEPSAASACLFAGISLRPVGGLQLTAHGGLGLGTMPGIPRARVTIGVAWQGKGVEAPVRDDRDMDGVRDMLDRCPGLPEDPDGHQDDDGCPEPDNDGDGIDDPADACPDHAGAGQVGCPPGAVSSDLDGDGVEPDDCPLQPEDRDGFEDEDGCPDPDNDGDGIRDDDDACPDRPEDGRRPQQQDGCPR